MSTIVVGVDGSEASKKALRFAIAEARLRDASVRAVYAWTLPLYGAGLGYVALPEPTELQKRADDMLEQTVREVVAQDGGVPVIAEAIEGVPAQVLVEQAGTSDLLVIGSRGRGGFTGLLLGSVSQQCTHHATCPVVIIRADEQAANSTSIE